MGEITTFPFRKKAKAAVHPVTARAMADLRLAFADVRATIADTETVAEAYAIWEYVKRMEALLESLTTLAGRRCAELQAADLWKDMEQ